jgi:ankyrin repeat protein
MSSYRIFECCKNNDNKSLDMLLVPNLRIYYYNSGLLGACCGGHIDIVKKMLSLGANVINYGLKYACMGGHMPIIKLMLQLNPSEYDSGMYAACKYGHINAVKYLLQYYNHQKHIDIDKYKNNIFKKHNEYLEYACEGGHIEIVRLISRIGCDNVYHAFIIVCAKGYTDILKFLSKAHSRQFMNHYKLLLTTACKYGCTRIVKYMLDYYRRGDTIFDLAGGEISEIYPLSITSGNIDTIKEVMSIFLVSVYNIGLRHAFTSNNFKIIKFMIENGAHNIHNYYNYIKNQQAVINIVGYGLNMTYLKNISGYDMFLDYVNIYKLNTQHNLEPILVLPIIHIINSYCW